MGTANKILSEITVHMKYARYLPEKQRREIWDELVTRNKEMHLKKFPSLKEEIEWAWQKGKHFGIPTSRTTTERPRAFEQET